MMPLPPFTAAASSWQNFYLLVGTAAATLTGLMFVAVTFGANLVTPKTAATARSFLDPSFTHFAQVLLTGCLITIPSMTPTVLGVCLMAVSALRAGALVRVGRHMRAAHRANHDLELSDWMTGILIPLFCHLLLAAAGVAFCAGYAVAFNALGIVTVVLLFNGLFGAWELMVWMAMARSREGQ